MKETIFEQIKKINKYNQEYWTARDLYKALEYSEYRFFESVIEKAKTACKNSGFSVSDHFEDVHDMVLIGSGAERRVRDINMSRYACYLIAQNGDPRKREIALAQTYVDPKNNFQSVILELLLPALRSIAKDGYSTGNQGSSI